MTFQRIGVLWGPAIFLLGIVAMSQIPIDHSPPMSAFVSSWNGTSELREKLIQAGFRVETLTSSFVKLNELGRASQYLLITSGLATPLSSQELAALGHWLDGGGNKAIVADDFGFGNQIFELFGIETLEGTIRALDPEDYYLSSALPIIRSESLPAIVLNHAVAFDRRDDPAGVSELRIHSPRSFIDSDNDKYVDPKEFVGHFPVVQSAGRNVVFVGDASIWTNDMLAHTENDALLFYILESFFRITKETTIIIDEAHHDAQPAGPSAYSFFLRPFDELIGPISVNHLHVKPEESWFADQANIMVGLLLLILLLSFLIEARAVLIGQRRAKDSKKTPLKSPLIHRYQYLANEGAKSQSMTVSVARSVLQSSLGLALTLGPMKELLAIQIEHAEIALRGQDLQLIVGENARLCQKITELLNRSW